MLPAGVGLADQLQADHRGSGPFHLLDPAYVLVGIGAYEEALLGELLVGHLLLEVELRQQGGLPPARSLDRRLIALGPREAGPAACGPNADTYIFGLRLARVQSLASLSLNQPASTVTVSPSQRRVMASRPAPI